MLLSDYRQRDLPIGKIQFLLAIVVGMKSYSDLEEKILKIETTRLADHIAEEKKRLGVKYLDNVKLVVDFVCNGNVIAYNSKYYNLYEYSAVSKKSNRFTIAPDTIYNEIMRLLYEVSESSYMMLFADTAYCHQQVTERITNNYKYITNQRPTTAKINYIFNDFKVILDRYSSEMYFKSNHDSPVGWVMRALELYSRNTTHYTDRANERNQDQIIGGDQGSTMLELQGVKEKDAININFPDVVSKITQASNLLYGHTDKTVAFSDIFTHYTNRGIEEIKNKIIKTLGTANSAIYKIVNEWDILEEDTRSHIRNKKNHRDIFATTMETIITQGVSVYEIKAIYNRLLEQNDSFKVAQNGSSKDGIRLFHSDTIQLKDNMSNGDRFKILYEGYVALAEFLRYLDSRDISPYSISPKIFRDIRFPRRFYTLDEYMKLGGRVTTLVNEAASDKEVVNGIMTNDQVFDSLIFNFQDNSARIKDFLRSARTLGDIKKVISHITEQENDEKFDSHCISLYRKYEPMRSYFAIGIIYKTVGEQKQSTQYLLKNPKQIREFETIVSNLKQQDGSVTSMLYPLYCGSDNYATFRDSSIIIPANNVNTRKYVATTYHVMDRYERFLVSNGCYEEMSMQALQMLSNALFSETYRNKDNIEKFRQGAEVQVLNNNKEQLAKMEDNRLSFITSMKVIETYVRVIKALMAQEGHPVVKNDFYVLTEDSFLKEFSYLTEHMEEKAAMLEIKRRYFMFRLAAKYFVCTKIETEWDLIHDVFVALDTREKYWLAILDVLGTAGYVKEGLCNEKEYNRRTINGSARAKFINDGAFAALIRLASSKSLLAANKPISDIYNFPILNHINIYGVEPGTERNTIDTDNHTNKVIIDVINNFIVSYPDIFDFFRTATAAINTTLTSVGNTTFTKQASRREEKELIEAANSIKNAGKVLLAGNDFQMRLREKLSEYDCESHGYLTLLGSRYVKDCGGYHRYLHNTGFWVDILEEGGYKLTPVSINEYENIRANKVLS